MGVVGRAAKLLLFALLPVALLVAAAELFAGATIGRRGGVVLDSASGRHTYVMRIGRLPWSRRATVPLNSLNFPDREFTDLPPKGDCVHVVFVGDSFFFGDGVDRDSSFLAILGRRVAARTSGPCVRTFNLGVRGTTIDRQAANVRLTMHVLQPDIVVLGQYQNDLTDLTNPGGVLDTLRPATPARPEDQDSIRVRLRILQPKLVRMLTYHTFAHLIRNGHRRDVLHHWSVLADPSRRDEANRLMTTYAGLFDGFAAEMAGRGIALGVVILPSKLDLMAQRYPEESFYLGLVRRHDLPHLRLYPILDAHRRPYTFLMYDGHLNEHGNRLVADAMYEWLFEQDPAPFPALRALKHHPPGSTH